MITSRIVRNGDAFLLEIDGKRVPMYGYMSYQPSHADYKAFREAGTHLFFTGVYAGDRGINQRNATRPFRPGFWKGYGDYDFSAVEEDFHIILDGATKAVDYLMPRLMVEPPLWWEEANPTELCRDAQGTPIHHSYQSKKWLDDTRRMLFDFQDWLNENGWAEWVPGWHMACGSTEEFIRPSHHPMQYSDYSDCAQAAFREWVRRHYENIDALNAAWRMGLKSFDDVEIPSPAHRMFASAGGYRDPQYEQYTIDYYHYFNEAHAQAAVDLCQLAKEATGHKQVIGAFFGYTYCDNESGHHGTDLLLRSEAVDFLASPFTYTDARAQGVDWTSQGSVDSAALHGKPWFMEADVRTYLSRPISISMPRANPYVGNVYDGPVWWGPKDLAGSLGQMTKAFARVITNNTAVWWFDMWGGWYRDPSLMAFHKQAAAIYSGYVLSGGGESAAPIALFIDDRTFDMTSDGWFASYVHALWKTLGFVGTPYRFYMMADFEDVKPDAFSLAIFYNPRRFTKKQLEALKAWKSGGRVLMFAGPADYSAATGIETIISDGIAPLPGEEDSASPVTARRVSFNAIPGDVVFDRDADSNCTTIMRRHSDHSIYATTGLKLKADTIRLLTAAGGGQVYTFDGDIAYANAQYVAIHAAGDGVKRVSVPKRARLVDVFTNQALPGSDTFVDIDMKKGDTRMLRVEVGS